MNTVKDDGGKAFPWCGDLNETPTINLGMSLRDWFAGQALVALVGNGHDKQSAVEYAYSTADAMIAERAK